MKNKHQRIIIAVICFLLAVPTVSYFINVSINLIVPVQFIWDTVFINGIIILFSLMALYVVSRNIKRDYIILLFIFLLLFFISYLIYPENRKYMFSSSTDFKYNSFYRLFLYAMPIYFYLRHITDYKTLYKYLSITAKIGVTTGILTYLFYILLGGFELQYMVFGYNMLFHVVFCFYDFFQNKKKISLILSIFGTATIFIGGARGPLVCIGAYLLLYFIINFKVKKFFILTLTSLIFLLIMYVSNDNKNIFIKLDMLLKEYDIDSRTISLIINNEYTNDSGRENIHEVLMKNIENNPIWGSGMFGDRAITRDVSFLSEGTYAHNFIIEFLSQYGVFIGAIFLAVFLLLVISALIISQDPMIKNTVLLFIPGGLIKLLLSGSYLNELSFFLLLAASMNAIVIKRSKNIFSGNTLNKDGAKNENFMAN